MIDKAFYEENGYGLVRGLFTPAEAADWKARAKQIIGNGEMILDESGVVVWMPEMLDDFSLDRLCQGKMVDAVVELLGPNVEFLSVKPVFKDGKTTFGSPWHQDWWYWHGTNKLSAWLALDDATPDNGCLKIIPGSHRQVFQSSRKDGDHGFVHRIIPADIEGLPVETIEVKAGDAFFFHDLLLHSSYPNTSGRDRWSMIPTYRDASQKDDATNWSKPYLIRGTSVNV